MIPPYNSNINGKNDMNTQWKTKAFTFCYRAVQINLHRTLIFVTLRVFWGCQLIALFYLCQRRACSQRHALPAACLQSVNSHIPFKINPFRLQNNWERARPKVRKIVLLVSTQSYMFLSDHALLGRDDGSVTQQALIRKYS